jgi:hypothetical protein
MHISDVLTTCNLNRVSAVDDEGRVAKNIPPMSEFVF